MESSTQQPKAETSSSASNAAGIMLGLGCFPAELTGGIFVMEPFGEALITLQMIASVEVEPLR